MLQLNIFIKWMLRKMNQRIKELITQAGGHWNHGDFNMPSSVEFQEQDIKKFAELIVQECLDIVEDEDDGSADTKAIRWAMIRIKKHFGVEE